MTHVLAVLGAAAIAFGVLVERRRLHASRRWREPVPPSPEVVAWEVRLTAQALGRGAEQFPDLQARRSMAPLN